MPSSWRKRPRNRCIMTLLCLELERRRRAIVTVVQPHRLVDFGRMPKLRKPPVPAARPASTSLLGVLVFLTGSVILVLEIVGARLLSPIFGSSLYVWSALIT